MREERCTDPRSEDRLLAVPAARVGRGRREEDPERLEPPYEGAVAEELDGVPVDAGFDGFEGELGGRKGKVVE